MSTLKSVVAWCVTVALAAVAVAALLAVFASSMFGISFVVVAGSSMEPALPYGSLAVMRDVDPADVRIGDIIRYPAPRTGQVTTHRVVRAEPGGHFVTRGDASGVEDAEPVDPSSVEARHVMTIPHVGRAIEWAKSPQAYLMLVLVPGFAIIGWHTRALFRYTREARTGHRNET